MDTDSFGVPASAGPGLPRRSEAKAGRVNAGLQILLAQENARKRNEFTRWISAD